MRRAPCSRPAGPGRSSLDRDRRRARHGRRRGISGLRDGRYRGRLRILAATGGLSAVNVVSLEDYLRGVVPREVPSAWQPEALQAQAVAARSYAIATRKPATSAFDLYLDERSQVYGGIEAEQPTASAAVDATAGQVVIYEGKPIVAYFSSSTGGRSAAVEEVFSNGRADAVPRRGRDPGDTISPLPRLDALARRPRRSQKRALPGARDRRARRRLPVGPRARVVTSAAAPARSSSRRRSCAAPGAALDVVHGRARGGGGGRPMTIAPRRAGACRNRVLLTGRPRRAPRRCRAAAGYGWRDIVTRPVADDGALAFRRPVGETTRYRLVAGVARQRRPSASSGAPASSCAAGPARA